jgi:rhomboid protease GluP
VPLPTRWQWKLDRLREKLSGGFRSEPEPARPRLCPACGKLVGASATHCHECGASLHFSLAAASRSLGSLIPSESPVTYFLLFTNLVFFALTIVITMRTAESPGLGVSGEALFLLGARQSIAIVQNLELWRLVMPIFLHGGWLHILFNTWVLMDLGPQLEETYGSSRYFFLYILTGILGFVLSTFWSLYTMGGFGISIGASGSLMGLVGLMIAVTQRRGGSYNRAIRANLVRWILYIFMIGLVTATDNAAHFGGLASGYLLGRVFDDREPVMAEERKRAYALGWFAGLVVVLSFVLMVLNFFRHSGE